MIKTAKRIPEIKNRVFRKSKPAIPTRHPATLTPARAPPHFDSTREESDICFSFLSREVSNDRTSDSVFYGKFKLEICWRGRGMPDPRDALEMPSRCSRGALERSSEKNKWLITLISRVLFQKDDRRVSMYFRMGKRKFYLCKFSLFSSGKGERKGNRLNGNSSSEFFF